MLYTLGNHKSKKIQYKYICCNFVYSKVESIEEINIEIKLKKMNITK